MYVQEQGHPEGKVIEIPVSMYSNKVSVHYREQNQQQVSEKDTNVRLLSISGLQQQLEELEKQARQAAASTSKLRHRVDPRLCRLCFQASYDTASIRVSADSATT